LWFSKFRKFGRRAKSYYNTPMHRPNILHTKIKPPRSSGRTLARERVLETLLESLNHRLTILQAGAGYGKSTALAVLAARHRPSIWYTVTEEDSDTLVFLLHLAHATQLALPELAELPIPLLEAWEGGRGPLPATGVLDQYLNALSRGLQAPALLVLDDIHLAESASTEIGLLLDRLVGLAPENLHILLASRPMIKLPNLARWKAQGEVLILDQSVLAFTTTEISALFSGLYKYELTHEEAELLSAATEGWAIALQLIWQSLRSHTCSSIEEALAHQPSSLDSLFEILAREVFGSQPVDVQEFLLKSATLREMTPEALEALRENGLQTQPDSAGMLAYLRRQELFVVEAGDGILRYHHIFHTFLREQTAPEQRSRWHKAAAHYFHERRNPEAALYHFFQAQDAQGAAEVLGSYGGELLNAGRLDTLAAYLDQLPPEILGQRPILLTYMGDLARLHSRFQEALGWYQQAENLCRERGLPEGIGRALRGQARVYLDTVNPTRAEELLEKALRLSEGIEDRTSQARLYELLAENKLNAGRPDEAEHLSRQAEALRSEGPSDSQLILRVLLRTGRLEEARQRLKARLETERIAPVYTPRAHRETLLLLSIINAFLGLAEEAYQTALGGTRRGDELQSPFVTAVGHIRQGHALMLLNDPDRYALARRQFEQSLEISQSIKVARLRVEASWGMCRAYGYQGDLGLALQYAQEGIEIASQAGDEWIASLVRLSYGASLTLSARYEAASAWLSRSVQGFQECSDPFSRAAAQIWLCLGWFRQKDLARLAQTLPEALEACRVNGYDFFFLRPSLLGPPDERSLIPLLILAREQNWEGAYASRLLHKLGLPEISLHPGYRLKIHTLGTFQVFRGEQIIQSKSWRREKSRQLLQLLLSYRESGLDRDQIIEYLWPEMDPSTAQRNFKVTLNTLYNVLEPEREPGSESAYISREGSVYLLRPGADLGLDVETFTTSVRKGEELLNHDLSEAMHSFQQALQIYKGEYLPEARYETWAAAERERLAVLFLRTADRLSELLLQQKRPEETIELCQRILACDNCWERAYRHLMLAFHELGDRGQVARTYQRCQQTLQAELEVGPAAETEGLFKRLKEG
jgi:LuxR family transcriptional regulator, maltose regulon positive regulatory protein